MRLRRLPRLLLKHEMRVAALMRGMIIEYEMMKIGFVTLSIIQLMAR